MNTNKSNSIAMKRTVFIKFSLSMLSLLFMAFQCERNSGDPFVETQKGRNVLGFYVGDDKYNQANYTAKNSVSGSYYYLYLNARGVEDSTLIGYYHRFRLDARVYPISTMTASIEVLELSFQILSKEPFQLHKKYPLDGMLPKGLLPENRSHAGLFLTDNIRPQQTDGGSHIKGTTAAKTGYIEFTKFEIPDNPIPNKPNKGIASGYFELTVDVVRNDVVAEEVKLTGGIFDVSM
jgi:hypothetical protein